MLTVFKDNIQNLSRQLVAQVDTSIEMRTENLLGREYKIVPVIAMVEGVRFGANADASELGLSNEFAQDIIMWANRPLVLNHPKTTYEGTEIYCSANSPDILETYAFGMTMNPYLEDSKLKMEAWIDTARVEELGGEFVDIVALIESGETVEVSVGFFSTLEASSGKFNGQSYKGIWRNIKPDHLAILSVGTLGACSIKDGCGIPRINTIKENTMSTTVKQAFQKVFGLKLDTSDTPCGCGGNDKAVCTCDHNVVDEQLVTNLKNEPDREEIRTLMSAIVTQSVDGSLMSNDVRKIIANALDKKYPNIDVYLLGFTSDVAIFESYGYFDNNYSYRNYQIGINVTEFGCEFVGDVQEVILLTKIVPVQPNASTIITNDTTFIKENDVMTNPIVPEVPVVANSTPIVVETVKPLTAQAYIDQAPVEIREMLQSSMKLHSDRKDVMVASIVANKSNKFTEAQLKAFDLGMLENLAALAGEAVIPNYGGVASASPIVNSTSTEAVPNPPRLFAVKA